VCKFLRPVTFLGTRWNFTGRENFNPACQIVLHTRRGRKRQRRSSAGVPDNSPCTGPVHFREYHRPTVVTTTNQQSGSVRCGREARRRRRAVAHRTIPAHSSASPRNRIGDRPPRAAFFGYRNPLTLPGLDRRWRMRRSTTRRARPERRFCTPQPIYRSTPWRLRPRHLCDVVRVRRVNGSRERRGRRHGIAVPVRAETVSGGGKGGGELHYHDAIKRLATGRGGAGRRRAAGSLPLP